MIGQALLRAGYGKVQSGRIQAHFENDLRKYQKQVDMVRRLVNHFSTQRSSYARVEVIVSTLHPEFNYQYRGQRKALEYLIDRDVIKEENLMFLSSELVRIA